ncbi:MAG: serine protease [Candidatus Omnitrophica bacterium]|nr:serine protease [Candidatus Omnitrophota bacterium]
MKILKFFALVTMMAYLVGFALPVPETLASDAMTLSEQLFFATVRIETEKTDEQGKEVLEVGTGFVVEYAWDKNKKRYFLVTSKHVVKGAKMGRFFFLKAENNKPVLGENYKVEIDLFESRWFLNKNPNIDVAVMPLDVILQKMKKRSWNIFFKSITENISMNETNIKDLDAIEEIIFVGYPSGLYDLKNLLPIARRGITATPLSVDYFGLPLFLIDASVFPGSSGSPVFIYNTGTFSVRENIVMGNRLVFLGLILGVYTREDLAGANVEAGARDLAPVIKTRQTINVGVVSKASTVFDTIREYLKTNGEIQ